MSGSGGVWPPRRKTHARVTPVGTYRVQDKYKFLDSDNDEKEPGASKESRDEDEDDSDTFMGGVPNNGQDEPDDEEEDQVTDEYGHDEYGPVDLEEDEQGDMEAVDDDEDSDIERGVQKRPKWKPVVLSTAAAAGLFRPRIVYPRPPNPPKPKPRRIEAKQAKKAKAFTKLPENIQPRGIEDWGRGTRGGGLASRMKDLFGPLQRDLKPVQETKHHWKGQYTLPACKTVKDTFYISKEAREREIVKLREWYLARGSECFARGQKSRALSKVDGADYLKNPGPEELNVLMGELSNLKVYTLQRGSSMSTATPFESKEDRRGWVLNLGSRIQAAHWASNENGSIQYLAVAVEQKDAKGPKYQLNNPQAPAFNPTTAFPASIQIWAFQSKERGELDHANPPKLELVICTDWGAPKQLKWCPFSVTDSISSEYGDSIRLGLLASMWSDGKVRILDISYSNDSAQTQYIHYTRAAFEIQIPSTVPTCIHWLSGTTLAIATAVGSLAIWTLTRPDAFPSKNDEIASQHNPQPWFYKQVADTFILTLASGYPSRSTFISFTTADGYSKLIDLRSPDADMGITNRGRMFGICQAWHEHTQSFLMPDETYLLRSNTIRRYYSNIHLMRTRSQITCCATSPLHPSVLVGGADGTVIASNIVGRVLNYKEVPYQQIWFSHEWRPPVDQLPLPTKTNNDIDRLELVGEGEVEGEPEPPMPKQNAPAPAPSVLAKPLTRFTEGFRVMETKLQPQKSNSGDPHTKDFIKPITIFEEPSCVTALGWNPNLRCGTWAVAGMGDGLLRVEDLGV